MMSGAMKAMGGAGPQLATRKAAYKWGAADATGPREYMEDAWAVRDAGFAGGYLFAAVMDGHGGGASSAYLREQSLRRARRRRAPRRRAFPRAVRHPVRHPTAPQAAGTSRRSLSRAYEAADETLIDHIARLGEPECWSGSTCTSVLVRHDRVVAANVGDSRAILVRDNKAIELTSDHRPVGSCKTGRQEMDRVVRAGGWSVGGRVCGILAVSRAFGDYEFKGGRFDLLEDLSEEPLAKKATLAEPPVVPTPRGVRVRAGTGAGPVARRRERRVMGHGQLHPVRDVHQAGDEEEPGRERGSARGRAREARHQVQNPG